MTDPFFARLLKGLTGPGAGYAQAASPPRDGDAALGALDLRVGEARYPLPAVLRAGIGDTAAALGELRYSHPGGEDGLRTAYLDHLLARPDTAGPGTVLVTAGGKEAAWLATRYLLRLSAGVGPVLVPCPGWEPYRLWLDAAQAEQIVYDPIALAAEPDLLRQLIADSPTPPALLILNYPHNPTGVALTQQGMNRLIEIAAEHHLPVVSDEVYRVFADGTVSAAHAPARDPHRHLVADSCSKALAVAGLRVGFLQAAPEVVWDLTAFRASYASCTSILTQHIAALLLTDPGARSWLADVRASAERDRQATVTALAGHGVAVTSHGGLYIWCRVPDPGQQPDTGLDRPGALVTTGHGFGAPDHIRLCTARAGLDPATAAAAVATTLRGH